MRNFFALFLVSFYLVSCSDEKKYTQEIAPPFKNVEVAYQQMEVDASEDKVLRLKNGSSISIPKNAFVDKNGNPVTGKVKLEYREFHSAADIIASGIPMIYEDEKGENKIMESGGMFEIKGKVNNEEVFISKGKELGVSMASAIPGEFDFYYLEEEGKPQQAEANLAFISSAYGQNEGSEKRKARWQKLTNKVDNPALAEKEGVEKDAKFFKLQFDTAKFPETKHLQSIQWQVATKSAILDPLEKNNAWISEEKWEIADVSQPKNFLSLKKEVSQKPEYKKLLFWQNHFEDTSRVIIYDGNISFYTFSGDKTGSITDTAISYFEAISEGNKRLVAISKGGNRVLWSVDGKKIKDLGNVYDVHFLNKGSRLIYSQNTQEGNVVFINDLNGKEILKVPLVGIKKMIGNTTYVYYHRSIQVSDDKNYFAFFSGEEIKVWNGDGKLMRSTSVSNIQSPWDITFAPYKNCIVLNDNSQTLKIWDWKLDKWYTAPIEEGVKIKYMSHGSCHPTASKVLIHTENNFYVLWDWEKNTLKKFEYDSKNYRQASFLHKGPLIVGPASQTGLYNIMNEEGKVILNASMGGESFFEQYSKDKKAVLLSRRDGLIWSDVKGKILKDFRAYDSTITSGYFKGNDKVMTLSKGNLITWGKDGSMLSSISIDQSTTNIIKLSDSYIFGYSNKGPVKVYDYKGNFISSLGFANNWIAETPHESILVLYNKDKVGFWNIASDTLPSNVYQLVLSSAAKSFNTYVKLNQSSLAKIQEYTKAKGIKMTEEMKRVNQETALHRSFQIRQFGIYNWDKFYKEENMIGMNADFDFGSSANAYNDVSLFLITGKEQNVVIKYYKGTWDKFKFDPKVPNLLLAVLPEDQIAIFDRKEFEKLNAEEIRKSGKYTFKMKVLSKVESVGALDKILKSPS